VARWTFVAGVKRVIVLMMEHTARGEPKTAASLHTAADRQGGGRPMVITDLGVLQD